MTPLDLKELKRLLATIPDIPRRISCSGDMFRALREAAVRITPDAVVYGLPLVVEYTYPRGVWCEHYRDRDVIHFADGRVTTIQNPWRGNVEI